jgi:translocation and assembly module TamA
MSIKGLYKKLFFWGILIFLGQNLHYEKVMANSALTYEISIVGIERKDLHKLLEEISDTVKLKDEPPASQRLLKKRVDEDIPKFITALKSMGFYDATAEGEIDMEKDKVHIIFTIDLGSPYHLKAVDIRISEDQEAGKIRLPDPEQMGLKIGGIAESKSILDAGNVLFQWIKREGYPFPAIVPPKLLVNHEDLSVVATFLINPGPRAEFGKTTITGIQTVDEVFVRKLIPWKEGDLYDADLLQTLRLRLVDAGLFSVIKIVEGQHLDETDRLPVTIDLKERKHRSVSAGVNYLSDEGLGVKASWEHRNLFHRGERFRVSGVLSNFTKAVEGSFRKPFFLRDDQNLQLALRVALDEPDAYTSRNIIGSTIVERNLREKMVLGGGMAFKQSQVEQLSTDNNFSLLSLPLTFTWDRSDDLLDPHHGNRLRLYLEPFTDLSNTALTFTRGEVTFRQYLQLLKKPDTVFAGRATVGSITGADRNDIPADERLYAGGAGSIRGYFYQSVGPLVGTTPLGGRSLLDLSLELRLKVTERFGLVGFLDGGTAYEGTHFNTGEPILWGAGGGIRYYTPIGPLRLDVGFPLDRREGIDDAFQLYLSIGQAF